VTGLSEESPFRNRLNYPNSAQMKAGWTAANP
jgi:hypothetical protein